MFTLPFSGSHIRLPDSAQKLAVFEFLRFHERQFCISTTACESPVRIYGVLLLSLQNAFMLRRFPTETGRLQRRFAHFVV